MSKDALGRVAEGTGPLVGLGDVAAVAIGGAIGALARFAVAQWAEVNWPRNGHVATLAINAIGSLVMGLLTGWLMTREWPMWVQRGVLIGVLGAFTTYSTFAIEAVRLHKDGRSGTALWYVLGTAAGCVVLAAVGYWFGARLAGSGNQAS